jgi:hypothetical protein
MKVRAPDSETGGAFTAKIKWRLYAENLLAPLRRQLSGTFTPKTKWLHNAEI